MVPQHQEQLLVIRLQDVVICNAKKEVAEMTASRRRFRNENTTNFEGAFDKYLSLAGLQDRLDTFPCNRPLIGAFASTINDLLVCLQSHISYAGTRS